MYLIKKIWGLLRALQSKGHRGAAVGHCFIVCVQCCGMVDSVQFDNQSLSCSQYIQTICCRGSDDNACHLC